MTTIAYLSHLVYVPLKNNKTYLFAYFSIFISVCIDNILKFLKMNCFPKKSLHNLLLIGLDIGKTDVQQQK